MLLLGVRLSLAALTRTPVALHNVGSLVVVFNSARLVMQLIAHDLGHLDMVLHLTARPVLDRNQPRENIDRLLVLLCLAKHFQQLGEHFSIVRMYAQCALQGLGRPK